MKHLVATTPHSFSRQVLFFWFWFDLYMDFLFFDFVCFLILVLIWKSLYYLIFILNFDWLFWSMFLYIRIFVIVAAKGPEWEPIFASLPSSKDRTDCWNNFMQDTSKQSLVFGIMILFAPDLEFSIMIGNRQGFYNDLNLIIVCYFLFYIIWLNENCCFLFFLCTTELSVNVSHSVSAGCLTLFWKQPNA